ncbi:hypothetical protein ACFWNN_02190 [Lentzea sp. NPDC058450]|uniref:hypothetical protein n=1 Tax=Lentzea sp. NPDC058450 TaxID=3346505 RepID=UPI003660D3B3
MAADEIQGMQTMQADADIVLNTAADPTQAAAWLPHPLRAYDCVLNAESHTVTWRENGEVRGLLTASPRGAGTSAVELVTRQNVADVNSLHTALSALETAVAEKLTAG